MSLRRSLSVLLVSAVILCAPSLLCAQDSGETKAEVFNGYSGYRAGGTVNGTKVPDFTIGWANQFIFTTSHWGGFLVDVNGHYNASASAHDFAVGPRFQFPWGHFIPFGEVLAGVQHFSPKGLPSRNAPTYIVGAGIDVKINSRLSFRPFQISFVNSNYSVIAAPTQQFNGVRVQSGLIYSLGGHSPGGVVIASCSAEPLAVDAGTAVMIGVTAKGFPRKRTLRYSYETTGGTIAGSAAMESVDTTGMKPGIYTVIAKVTDNRGEHQQIAGCDAKFTVSEKPAPLVAAAANEVKPPSAPSVAPQEAKPPSAPSVPPQEVKPPSARSVAAAPESAKSGDTSATTVPAQPAAVNAQVAFVLPQPSKFGTIEFKRDVKRPTRVDNEAKGELDRYADALAAAPDVKGALVGYARAMECKDREQALSFAGLRAVNTKDYLTKEKGIDPTRIQPRTSRSDGQKTELWIVPAGASFAAEGNTVVDESRIKPVTRIPLKTRNAHKTVRRKYASRHRAGQVSPAKLVRGSIQEK